MDSEHYIKADAAIPAPVSRPVSGGPRYAVLGIAALLLATLAFLAGMVVDGSFSARPATPGVAISGQGVFMSMADSSEPYDLRFIDEMIMHHQGAIMSAQMMITSSTHPQLRSLGQRIVATQQQQIDQMETWRKQWYPNAPTPSADMGAMMTTTGTMMPMPTMTGTVMPCMMCTMTPMPHMTMTPAPNMNGGMMGGGTMGGMMGGGMGATGTPTTTGEMMGGGMMGMMGGDGSDRMFLQMMIPHHQLAIDMAQDALKNAQHDELKGLARTIISGQSAEITEMEGYLKTWYNQGSTRDLAAPMREMMRRMMGK